MLTWAVILFAVAAVGGVTMLSMQAGGRQVPMWLALLHGAAAATALVLLAVAVFGGAAGPLAVALAIFVLAALGGFVLFARYLKTGAFPMPLAIFHGGAAVVAFLILLAGLYF